jgi:peptidoglycan L-alanyl-D-glutamate endopeptidase CwlK
MKPFHYGFASSARISTLHPLLQSVLAAFIRTTPVDSTIVCGARNEDEQNAYFDGGWSKVRWPDSKHNAGPGAPRDVSDAFDFAPWINGRIDWDDEGSFYSMAGAIIYEARRQGIVLRYGGDWNRNGLTEDQTFMDLGHLERVP